MSAVKQWWRWKDWKDWKRWKRWLGLMLLLLALGLLAGCGVTRDPLEDRSVGVTDSLAAAALAEARTYVGVPYVYGGQSRSGLDCSGLVVVAYKAVWPELKFRQADGSYQNDVGADALFYYNVDAVPLVNAKPGDLLFMATAGPDVDHVAIFESLSGNMISYIHATATAGVVKETTRPIDDGWWASAFRGAGRLRVYL
jgi:cell wall-associated NlpC family hydrolase